MSNDVPDHIFKLVILGDTTVGKTNIVIQYFKSVFLKDSKATVGVEFNSKTITYKGKIIKAQIWDTAGQERYKSITTSYFKGAKGAIIVYDITKRSTYDNVDEWYQLLKQSNNEEITMLLIGNKTDLIEERVVSSEEGEKYAKRVNMCFMETSAKEKVNIDEAFTTIMNIICERLIKEIPIEEEKIMNPSSTKQLEIDNASIETKEKKKCCK